MTALSEAEAAPFSAEGFRRLARERLLREPPQGAFDPNRLPERGDHQLAPDILPADGSRHRKAAVLVPVVARDDEAGVLLTRRAAHLRDHSGQVAFPGGKIDEADPSATAAALREAFEEIGLARAHISPLGYLDAYLSGTGYRILPVVALVSPGYVLALNPDEVDAAFEVPLRFLMTPENHARHAREWRGALRHYYAMPYEQHYIWGVTAGILRNLYERVYGA